MSSLIRPRRKILIEPGSLISVKRCSVAWARDLAELCLWDG